MGCRCRICDKNGTHFNEKEQAFYCGECVYWIERARGYHYEWQELADALEYGHETIESVPTVEVSDNKLVVDRKG